MVIGSHRCLASGAVSRIFLPLCKAMACVSFRKCMVPVVEKLKRGAEDLVRREVGMMMLTET